LRCPLAGIRFFRAVLVLFCAGAIYGGLYESCVRCPRVPFRSWAWPYYAVALPCGIDRGSVCQTDCRLPEQLAERFFYPANWIDRKLHPTKWAEKPVSILWHVGTNNSPIALTNRAYLDRT
jgi:hypothetical protein